VGFGKGESKVHLDNIAEIKKDLGLPIDDAPNAV
jgi:hypothetical protein